MYSRDNHHLTIQRLFDTSHVHATPCGPNNYKHLQVQLQITIAVTLTPTNLAIMKFFLYVTLLAAIQGLAVNAAPALTLGAAKISYNAVGAVETNELDVSLGQTNTPVHA
jgi:hypothetical protein